MSSVLKHSDDVPVAVAAVQAGLMLQLRAAEDACRQIADLVNEAGCSSWAVGHAEGAALHAASVAEQAVGRLRVVLEIRLHWPDVEAAEPDELSVLDAARALAECGFCHGQPVGDADEWVDGTQRPPLPCPRCGETHEPAGDEDRPF